MVDAALDEARECLAGHEGLQKQFDTIYQNRQGWASLHKHAMEQGDDYQSPIGKGA